MYGRPAGRPLDETRAYAAHTKKGKLRAQMADDLLTAHQKGQVEVAIGRASDYFGPRGGAQSNLGDRLFPDAIAGKTASVLGDPDQPHTYTYIPDIGEGLAVLGEHPDAPGQVWHLPNDPDTRTTRQLCRARLPAGRHGTRPGPSDAAAASPPGRGGQPHRAGAAGDAVPVRRTVHRRQHQDHQPLGVQATPIEQALADTLATYQPRPTQQPRTLTTRPSTTTPHSIGRPDPALSVEIRPSWPRQPPIDAAATRPPATAAAPQATSRIGLIVAASMAAGLVAAVVLVAAPVHPCGGECPHRCGAAGFCLGWALLAVLSVRFSDQPQRWAAAPAVFMAVTRSRSHSAGPPPCTMCSAGCGRQSCSGWWSGCSCGSDDSCAAEAHGGCCTPS